MRWVTSAQPYPSRSSSAALENTYWKLTRLGKELVTVPERQREPHLILHSHQKRVAAFGGCNDIVGSYATRPNPVRVGISFGRTTGIAALIRFIHTDRMLAAHPLDNRLRRIVQRHDPRLLVLLRRDAAMRQRLAHESVIFALFLIPARDVVLLMQYGNRLS
jgi:hypothetical protein